MPSKIKKLNKGYEPYPAMRYHPETGEYTIVKNEKEDEALVGWLKHPSDLPKEVKAGINEPVECFQPQPLGKPAKSAKKTKDEDNDPSLEDLGFTREEAMKELDEEGISYKKNISNTQLALLLAPLLEDED